MDKNYLKFVIVGHVDHGKSSLIGRLLYECGLIPEEKITEVKTVCAALGRPFEFCFLLDYLEEERQKNITIDTTQIFFNTVKRNYVIIDAPGHKEFLKNMITGSSQAETAVLIVDAKEGVKEQTKRHAYLLSLLSISQLIVAVNKMDLVGYRQNRFNEVGNELLKHLTAVNLKPNFIIPISASEGDNIAKKSEKMGWNNGPAVLEALDSFKNKVDDENLPLRLPIQDVYPAPSGQGWTGVGVYDGMPVGQIESGILKKSEEIIILPANKKARVAEIKKWQPASPAGRRDLSESMAGDNVGVILEKNPDVNRGDVLCSLDRLPRVTADFKATIFWMSQKPLPIGEKFNLKLATQASEAQIKKIHKLMDSSSLELINRNDEIRETEVAEVEIETTKPLVFEDFNYLPPLGRFVIVKDEDIAGGGIITKN